MSLSEALLLDPAPFNVWIAVRTDGIKGSGTLNDPFDGSSASKFDALMNSQPANTRIHLGAGIFQTKGYADGVDGGWQPKAGMKIIGSGIGVTTLQLTGTTTTNRHYFAIGHALAVEGIEGTLADFLEVSDLTIDCNLSSGSAAVACGAIRMKGNHARVQRVRAINWGSKSTATECRVISVITSDPESPEPEITNTGIQDCVVDSPFTGSVATVTALHAGVRKLTGDVIEYFGKSPFIRNCFVDGGTTALTVDLRALSMNACRGGVVEGNHVHNIRYGGPYEQKHTVRDVIVRNNFYKNVIKGPCWLLGTLSVFGSVSVLTRNGTEATATSSSTLDLNLAPGDLVKIGADGTAFDGVFAITSIPAADQFKYATNAAAGTASSPIMQRVFSASRIIVEGNIIELAPISATQLQTPIGIQVSDDSVVAVPPPYAHGDIIIRNNKIRYVDGVAPDDDGAILIEVQGAMNLIVQNNVLDTIAALPLENERCGHATYFNNRTPAGVLLRGLNEDTNVKYDELETEAEDAFVLALFNEH